MPLRHLTLGEGWGKNISPFLACFLLGSDKDVQKGGRRQDDGKIPFLFAALVSIASQCSSPQQHLIQAAFASCFQLLLILTELTSLCPCVPHCVQYWGKLCLFLHTRGPLLYLLGSHILNKKLSLKKQNISKSFVFCLKKRWEKYFKTESVN